MRRTWRRIAILAACCASAAPASADPPKSPAGGLVVPAGLPRYEIDAKLDLDKKLVTAEERVHFTNRSTVPVTELVFHAYPHFRVKDQDRMVLGKTLEMLRLSPEEAMDSEGRRLVLTSVVVEGKAVEPKWDANEDTVFSVALSRPVAPGESVEATVAFTLQLPNFWGRWGHHGGITYLVNWYPVLAHHDARGWERTPFIPWHQPWHQEAGHYLVKFDLPTGQVVASTGLITGKEASGQGRERLTIVAEPARDFALVCSDRFETRTRKVGSTTVRVHAFPEDKANAEKILEYASEVIPLYEAWFGPYGGEEFEIAPSYFGWNGNECSGLVLIDERVMRLPSAGERYLEHLVTHETCHQWFWNVVGTDGFAESFMDEGPVNCFTALRLDAKYGRNSRLIVWPSGLGWLPTIGREDLRLAGYYGWRARGNTGPVIQDLKTMGNLNTLFSLAYDRGGKVVEMIHNRLGEDRFFAFFRKIYHDYAYGTLHYADLRRELIAFDSTGDWGKFLDGWLVEHGETDWSVERVDVGVAAGGAATRPVTVELKQKGAMVEPTVLLCRCGETDLRVPIWPDRGDYEVPGATVVKRPGDGGWSVTLQAPSAPTQVEVDPDHALLDAKPDNNRWRTELAWRVTPMMTPLDDSAQFQAYDKPSLVAGPFVDQYARGGVRVGLQRVNSWQVTAWAGTEPALREAIFGGQAALLNVPWPSWTVGLFYEEGLYNFYNDRRHSGGRAFMRYRFLETSSFLVDDQGFIEAYLGTGNEFWAGDNGRPVDAWLDAVGVRYRLNTLLPFWDPVKGRLIELGAEYGVQAFGSGFNYTRLTGEYGVVHPFPDVFGYRPKSRVAFRAFGGFGYPDHYPLFRLGGGQRLRALNLSQNLGSSVWLSTFEWRYPLWADIDTDLADHVVGLRNLLGAVFYDVGQSYLRGSFGPVVHGVGVGLRLDVSLFAFLERAALRVDLAQPVGLGTSRGPVLWFGLNQVF